MPAPRASIIGETTHQSQPARSSSAAAALTRAMIEPTERSMPPVVITKVMATATMSVGDAWRRRLSRLPVEKKTGLIAPKNRQQPSRKAAIDRTWACVCRKSESFEPCWRSV